ncbi:ATP-binding protein [Archaeoglobus sp.]
MYESLKQLAETIYVPLLLYDERGVIVYANQAFWEVIEPSRKVVGETILEIIHPDDREKVKEAIRKRLAGEIVKSYTLRVQTKDGRYRTFSVVGGMLQTNEGKLGVVALTDVTKLEEQKLMLQLLNRALRHDVLNVFTAARMCGELLKEFCEDREEAKLVLEKLETTLERGAKIITNLRAFEEAVVEGRLEKINVREVIEDVAKHFDVSVKVEGNCEVVADRGLRTIFDNLFQNAVQHGKTDRIEVKVKRVGDFCEIRVADYGRGIPEEIKDKIFDEGFAYGKAASTGQGLYLVKKLVERYGGEIWVEKNQPSGSVFVLKLRSWSLQYKWLKCNNYDTKNPH